MKMRYYFVLLNLLLLRIVSFSLQGATYKEGTVQTDSDLFREKGDRDGDGVKDKEDNCPDLKGPKKNAGCPEITIELWTSFYVALSNVYFQSDSDKLTEESATPLDTVASLMTLNKGFILKVSGYADSLGAAEHNKWLSEKRAQVVKHYLVNKGIPAKRIHVAAFGERMPKEPNTTPTGRAANRRVEFDLFY